MTAPAFTPIEIVERLTLPHPRMAWPWAEIKLGRKDGAWFFGIDYNLPGGEGGGGPCADGPHEKREDAILAGAQYLRRRIGDRLSIASLHTAWLDEIEAGLKQPDLFGDAA